MTSWMSVTSEMRQTGLAARYAKQHKLRCRDGAIRKAFRNVCRVSMLVIVLKCVVMRHIARGPVACYLPVRIEHAI